MNKPRIGMVLDAVYPNDVRLQKEMSALHAAGFEVHLLCGTRPGLPTEEFIDGAFVFRAEIYMDTKSKGWRDIFSAVRFVNKPFERAMMAWVKEKNIEVLHIHDLPLAKTGKRVADHFGIPWVLDLHENYPEGLKTWFEWRTSPLIRLKNRLFFGYNRWLKYERWAVQHAPKIIAVVEEMAERLVSFHGAKAERIHVVSNTESVEFIKNFEAGEELHLLPKEKFNITYVGGMGPHRGLDTAIKAMPEILQALPQAQLNLVGSGNIDVLDKLKALVNELKLQEKVKFYGQRPFKEVVHFMKSSEVNIIPHVQNEHTNNTIPHKLFQIMMSGAPLLVSDCQPLARIVKQSDGGYIFEASNPHDFAKKVLEMHQNPQKTAEKTKNALISVENEFNWEKTVEVLFGVYGGISEREAE
ncbi:MAG: glycosyltransferase family 4 protein [Flavobacteriales bacterium]|nr:glycosyltransferase family 4 protein [Flavobacteriales bacterium]